MLNYCDYSGIVKRKIKKHSLIKNHNVFISVSYAPLGWIEVLTLIKNKMEK